MDTHGHRRSRYEPRSPSLLSDALWCRGRNSLRRGGLPPLPVPLAALRCCDACRSARAELTEDRIGEFAVGLDVLFARDRVALGVVDGPGVAEQFTEDVVDEVAEELSGSPGTRPGGVTRKLVSAGPRQRKT